MIGWAIFLLFAPALLFAQKEEAPIYKTLVYKQDKSWPYKGYLLELQDSAMVFSTKLVSVENIVAPNIFRVENIRYIRARKKGSVGAGMIIGFGAGLIVGVLASQTSPCDPSILLSFCELEKVSYTMGGGLMGITIGGIIGGSGVKIPIKGDFEIYQASQGELARFVYHF